MALIRDAHLGRISFVTVADDIKEAAGDALEAVGAGVVAGERRPRTLELSIPLHGDSHEADPFATGYRLRRQVRALVENGTARFQGLYFRYDVDPEQNGWLLIGTGDIEGEEGALVLADWTLALGDVYRVAKLLTHRPARRLRLYDRRLATTADDILGKVFATDWSSLTPIALHFLPVGATELLGASNRVIAAGARPSLAGDVVVVPNALDADVVHYEWDEAHMHLFDDVVLWDQRGMGELGPSAQAVIYTLSPVGFWRLGEPEGSTVMEDSSREAQNGVYDAGLTPQLNLPGATGDGDTAAAFTVDRYGKVPDSTDLSIVGDMTVMGWLRPAAETPDLIDTPEFEVDLGLWFSSVSAGATTNDFSRSNTWAKIGSWSLHVRQTNAADTTARTLGASLPTSAASAIPVKPNQVYTAWAAVNVVDGTPNGLRMTLFWWQADGRACGTPSVAGAAVGARSATGEFDLLVSGTAPADAAYCTPFISSDVNTASEVLEYYLDAVHMAPGRDIVAAGLLRPRFDVIASKWRSATTARSYRFAYDAHAQELRLELSSDGNSRSIAKAAVALATDEWAHLAAVYLAATGQVVFYVNGIPLGTVSGMPTSIFDSTTPFGIGKWDMEAS